MDFSPDGKTMISSSFDGTIRLWVTSIGDLLQMADEHIQRTGHVFSNAEKRQFGLDQ